MSTQLLGFSLGGILQHFLVYPPSMSACVASGDVLLMGITPAVWPAKLVTCTLFNTLHSTSYAGIGTRGGISRGRFFLYAWIASMCWYFLPGYLFQGLSYFSWICWIVPNNIVVNQLFGYVNGLGMSLFTFDWAQISYIGVYTVFGLVQCTHWVQGVPLQRLGGPRRTLQSALSSPYVTLFFRIRIVDHMNA